MKPFVPVYQTVLFDLDGTLTDPFVGIQASLVYAFEQLSIPAPSTEELRKWVGPPLFDSFYHYLGDAELAKTAIKLYRDRYVPIGAFENMVYLGIPELLSDLRAAGCGLAVATSKLGTTAHAVLQHFQLAEYFAVVSGPSPDDEHESKGDLIRKAITQLGVTDHGSVVMVGDRLYDIVGARDNQIPVIAVAYGYGSPEEFAEYQPTAVAETVPALRHMLLKPAEG